MKKNLLINLLLTLLLIVPFQFNSQAQTTSGFNEISLEPDSYWNGSDNSGGFRSGNILFPNTYTDWGGGAYSFNGFAVSNMGDTETPGIENQYSSITGQGYNGNENYAIAYVSDPETFETRLFINLLDEASGGHIKEIAVTNSTYAALAMRDGDEFSKKFGGESGSDPDWFLLEIIGWKDGAANEENKIDFYLADYRFEDNSQNYIVDTWELISLESLGRADSLELRLSSSDAGDWGMKTPAYLCIGEVTTTDNGASTNSPYLTEMPAWEIYPNPFASYINIKISDQVKSDDLNVVIFDMSGRKVFEKKVDFSEVINLSFLPNGIYLAKMKNGQQHQYAKIIKH